MHTKNSYLFFLEAYGKTFLKISKEGNIVGLLHRSLMQSNLCDLSYKLARQWLSGVNHGMTNEEIVAVMYPE